MFLTKTGCLYGFLNLRFKPPSLTVASLPLGTYVDAAEWLVTSVICIPEKSAALYTVDDVWQTPPPGACWSLPYTITGAFLYPLALLLGPVIAL